VIAIAVQVQDGATPAVNRLAAFLSGPGAVKVLAIAGRKVVKEHLDNLQATRPNRLGGPRTDYYGAAARATNWRQDSEGAIVAVSQVGMRLHYLGGTVTPGKSQSAYGSGPTKYLAIPAVAFAHGKRPSDFTGLSVLWGKQGPVALGRRYMGQTTVVFWLVKKTEHKPDPTVLPTSADYRAEFDPAILEAMRRKFKGLETTEEGEA
jgi:hypothetical protein